MTSRMKEEEKNEKIIRGLLKLPANRKCINCNNLGPQYVCTNFWTFICTNCSGLHREFCHRVKSISMAKFTTPEVKALQEGGNEKAREIYFKVWDSQRNSLPDSSHTDRLRDFIKQVYVYRKFTGEKNTDKPPQGKVPLDGERSPAYGNDNISGSTDSGRRDSYRSNSRSPPYNEQPAAATGGRNPNRCFRYVYGERSPAYNQGDKKRSPCRFVVVDDRVRDDKFAGGSPSRKFEERRIPNVLTKSEGSSPSRPKDMFSPSIVGPIRDILGDYAPQLHVVESPKSDCPRVLDKPALTQRSSSSPSLGASDRNPLQMKIVNLVSLIDFDADPEPPSSAAPQQSVQQTTSPLSNGGDWASFHIAAPREATESTVRSGTLDSAVSPLSGHAPSTREEMPTLAICAVESSPIDGEKQPTMQQYQTSSLPADQNPQDPPSNALVVADQLWGSSVVPNPQEPLTNPAGHLSQDLSRTPPQDKTTVVPSSPSVEAKPAVRKELPADLFTALYPVIPASIPGWQMSPHPSIGYGMQYPMGMVHPQLVPTFPLPSKSTNPFDVAGEPALARAPTFPSMEFLQGGLPNVPEPSPLLRSSSFGNPSQQWAASQQSSFPLALSQGQYMVQQVPNNMHQLPQNQLPQNFVKIGHEGTGSPISVGSMYGNTSSMDTQSTGRYSQPASPNSYSPAGGNPFG